MMGQLAHDNNHVSVISTVGAGSARPMETKQPQFSVKCHFSNLLLFARQYLCCQPLMNSPMTKTAHLSFRRSYATEKSQKTINRDPSALRFVGMTNNTGNKAKTCVFIKLLYRSPVGVGSARP